MAMIKLKINAQQSWFDAAHHDTYLFIFVNTIHKFIPC